MIHGTNRCLAFAAVLAVTAPAAVSAGEIDLFFSTLEGLEQIDSTPATSSFDSGAISSTGGIVTHDAKSNSYAHAIPALHEFGDGTMIGIAQVGSGLLLKGVDVEVPIVGKFHASSKETEEWTTSFDFLTERFDIAEQFSWKGKTTGEVSVGVSVKYGDKITTFDTKGLDSFTENGSTAISIGKDHKGKSTLSMGELTWASGQFNRTETYSQPKPGQWNGEAIYNSAYTDLIVKGGDTLTGGQFSLSTKPATEKKYGTYSTKAKLGARSYSERGLLDLSAAELAAITVPEEIFAFDSNYFNTAVGFRSPASSDTYRVRFVKP